MSDKSKNNKVSNIWSVVNLCGIVVIILSVIGGGYIINEFGFIEADMGFGITTTQTNIIGTAAGVAAMIQGVIIGLLMIAFSKLGESVYRIEKNLIDSD